MSNSLPHPRLYDMLTGQLWTGSLIMLLTIYVGQPWLRPALDAGAGALLLMVPAALGGVLLRVGSEMRGLYAAQYNAAGLLMALVAGCWAWAQVGRQDDLGAQLVAIVVAIVVSIAIAAGYTDGDDEVWRRRHGL